MANPFVHLELNTPDLAKAKQFYGQLFGWQFEDMDMGPDGTYSTFKVDSGPGGGMTSMPRRKSGLARLRRRRRDPRSHRQSPLPRRQHPLRLSRDPLSRLDVHPHRSHRLRHRPLPTQAALTLVQPPFTFLPFRERSRGTRFPNPQPRSRPNRAWPSPSLFVILSAANGPASLPVSSDHPAPVPIASPPPSRRGPITRNRRSTWRNILPPTRIMGIEIMGTEIMGTESCIKDAQRLRHQVQVVS